MKDNEKNLDARSGDSYDDNVTLEPTDGEGNAESAQSKLKALREKLKTAERERDEYLAGWQRAKADYVNLKRESEEGRSSARRLGISLAAKALLPALDALDRARGAGKVSAEFEGIERLIKNAFSSLDIHPISAPPGSPFDPALHEALGQDPVDAKEKDDTVTAVLEGGWRAGDTVIRPAKVRVGVHRP